MWNGKLKAVTFSFDDGVIQDKRLVELLKKYNIKATFNLNSNRSNIVWELNFPNYGLFKHTTLNKEEWIKLYEGFEVAGHSLTHPDLIPLNDEEIIRQVKEDNLALEKMFGYPIYGFAYPGGAPNADDRVANIIKNNTNVKYARIYETTHNFDLQENLYLFKGTIQWLEPEFESLVERCCGLDIHKVEILHLQRHDSSFVIVLLMLFMFVMIMLIVVMFFLFLFFVDEPNAL